MENKTGLIEPLFEKVEQYSKTSIELLKLKAIDKISTVASSIISQLFLVIVFSLFIIVLSIASAFYFGDLLGEVYYGFLVVAGFYGTVGIILVLMQAFIKVRLNDVIVKKFLK